MPRTTYDEEALCAWDGEHKSDRTARHGACEPFRRPTAAWARLHAKQMRAALLPDYREEVPMGQVNVNPPPASDSGSEDDEEERWEDEQHHREHHLDGREPCELFRPLTTLGTKLQRLILQDLCEAHPERVGLDDRIYEPADVGKGGAASEFTQRL